MRDSASILRGERPARRTVGTWDREIRSPLQTAAARNIGRGGSVDDLIASLAGSELAELIQESTEVQAGDSVVAILTEAHQRAERYVSQATSRTADVLTQFRRLPVQPSRATASSTYQVLDAVIAGGQAAGMWLDKTTGLVVPMSERQIEVESGVTRNTVRAAKKRLGDLGWLSTQASTDDGPQRLVVASPWSPALTGGNHEVGNDCSNHVHSLSVNERMNGADTAHSSVVGRPHLLWSPSGLGDTGRRIYGALAASPEGLRAADLYGPLKIASRRTVGPKLHALADIGLAEKVGPRWVALPGSLDAAAKALGLLERQGKARAFTQRERDNYRTWRASYQGGRIAA